MKMIAPKDLSRLKPKDVKEYLAAIPPQSRTTLNKLRKTVRTLAPRATEVISYQIPTFKDGRPLVAYAAFSDHCSFFPLSAAIMERFKKELISYDTSRGTIRFPIDKPLSPSLVKKIVRARIKQNKERDFLLSKTNKRVGLSEKFALPDGLAKPAQRALASARIQNLRQLSRRKETDVRHLHGIGPNALVLLRKALRSKGLAFAPMRMRKKSG